MKKTKKLNLVKVNTTAFSEEDFLLLTSLTEEQIIKVISPIVEDERENNIEYDNDFLVAELEKEYPNDVVRHYIFDQIDLISI